MKNSNDNALKTLVELDATAETNPYRVIEWSIFWIIVVAILARGTYMWVTHSGGSLLEMLFYVFMVLWHNGAVNCREEWDRDHAKKE